jgi:pectate lyase
MVEMKKIVPFLFIFVLMLGIAPNPASASSYSFKSTTGWASVNADGVNGTTGGSGGTEVTVTNAADLERYATANGKYIIKVSGSINLSPKGKYIDVSSNKTIIGLNASSEIINGGLKIRGSNVIVKNLTIRGTYVEDDWDGKTNDYDGIQITGKDAHHIWIDHVTMRKHGDGLIDIVNGANYVTISNSRFEQHNKSITISGNDNDTNTDKYKVTIHDCWFRGTTQRNPRVRFGMVHLYNNYYSDMGKYGRDMGYSSSLGYAIGVGVSAKIYSENNYFENLRHPTSFIDTTSKPGYVRDSGSYFVNSGSMTTRATGITWKPSDYYSYTLRNASQVRSHVINNAGAGK